MLFIFAFIIIWICCFICRPTVIKETENSSSVARVFSRALINTLCFGIGVIGGEGFGLPGPITGALIFYNGPNFYLYTAIYPFVFWLALFIVGQYIKEKDLLNKFNAYLTAKKLTNNWKVFLLLIFIAFVVISLQTNSSLSSSISPTGPALITK